MEASSPVAAMDSHRTIKVPTLHHINLKTIRMQEMIDWYGTVIGARPNVKGPTMAFLTNDGANHRIALLSTPKLTDDPDRRSHVGLHHSAFEYATVEDLLDTWVRLHTAGIEPHMSLDHGMTLSCYYVDPDGNSVELQADWFGDWTKSTEWMKTSPEFAANPVGQFLDMTKMVAARDSGTDVQELHRRSYAGQFEPATPQDMRIAL